MAKVFRCKEDGRRLLVIPFCPACKDSHHIDISRVDFNEDINLPTLSQQINQVSVNTLADIAAFTSAVNFDDALEKLPVIHCHFVLQQGIMHFADSCSHDSKGTQTELPDINLEYYKYSNVYFEVE